MYTRQPSGTWCITYNVCRRPMFKENIGTNYIDYCNHWSSWALAVHVFAVFAVVVASCKQSRKVFLFSG